MHRRRGGSAHGQRREATRGLEPVLWTAGEGPAAARIPRICNAHAHMDQQRAAPNLFSGSNLDRLATERGEPGWLESARAAGDTRYVVATRGGLVLLAAGESSTVALLEREHPLVLAADTDAHILLGAIDGARRVLIEAQGEPHPGAGLAYCELRPAVASLSAQDAALAAYARGLALWRARQRHCGVCGAPTASLRAGHVLQCTSPACRSEFFPRIDPAVIVLVTDGDYALLGRQPGMPPGRYSTLAGFVEPAESLEDAARREVLEETGVQVLELIYHSSQPWPFPSQLMLGFHALADRAAPPCPDVDGELEEFGWFSRRDITSGAIRVSPPGTISHLLIASWVG